jgi:hypothetical protein
MVPGTFAIVLPSQENGNVPGNRRSPMKKLTIGLMALAAMQGIALQAQEITGNWQGALQPGQQKVRLVFQIAQENNKLTATIRTADQYSPPIVTTITAMVRPSK